MAKYKAIGSVIKAVTSTGTPAAVGNVTGYSFEGNASIIDATVLGEAAKTYEAGVKDYSISVDCLYDPADAAQVDMLEGESVNFEILPETGNKITGTGLVETVSITGELDGMISATHSIKPSGGVTRAAVT